MNKTSSGLLHALKHRLNVLRGKDVVLSLDTRRSTEYHGSEYGGFAILEDSLRPDSVVLSCGVGEDASFDMSIIRKYKCRIIAVDPTPKAVNYVRRHIRADGFSLLEIAVSSHDGLARFYLPQNPDWVSGSLNQGGTTGADFIEVSCLRLGSILRKANTSRLDLLKLDIEGAEYDVLDEYISDRESPRAKQIALEFHHHFQNYSKVHTLKLCDRLREAGYALAWVSSTHREALFVESWPGETRS
jgi:FkbM family methyltransferase